MKKLCVQTLFIMSLLIPTAFGQNLKLASLFANDMVLQQQTQAPIWGKAKANTKISIAVSWSKVAIETGSDTNGNWRTSIETPKAGGPFNITVKSGEEKIELKNVLSGEVWICSGQSNMQWKMRGFGVDNFKEDIEKANYPNIRFCQVKQVLALESQEEIGAKWSQCNPRTALEFSSVGFFFGVELYKELNVPIGLISTNWGGSSAEAWVSEEVLRKDFPEFNKRLDEYSTIIEQTGKLYPNGQKPPAGMNQRNPSVLYNSMIKPLVPFAFRGVIWYQGESNVKNPVQYRKLFPRMIQDWRERWSIGNFPFYYVQIAPFNYNREPISSSYLREAQMMALAMPNTGMAVTMDIGEATNIHPKQKKPVGHRLALLALAKDYGKSNLVYSGPEYISYKVEGNKIRLNFDYIGSGLVSRDGKELTHFVIAGEDKKFVPAKAVIDGDTILVSSDKVAQPAAVRYGWGNADMPNLANKEGLPSSSFRTDKWEIGK
ncbi:MAG: 9-O-acetylesterase [Phycisphaerae bacterium]|nr:9-O-acetylesterase [Phycisphaerae bacterium]